MGPPKSWNTAFHFAGFITASVLGVYSYTDSGVLLDSLVVPDLYSSFKDIEKISDNLFFVLCTPDSYTVTYVVDINLTVTQTDTVATGLFPVAVCNGSSGALFVTARNMLNDSLVLLRFSESGEFEYLRMFYDNQLLYIGSDFFSTTAGVLCVQVNRTNGLKHYQFYSEDLESLGTLTLHDDGHSSIADDDGGMLVSSWVGTHFFVTKFGTTPTPTNSTPPSPTTSLSPSTPTPSTQRQHSASTYPAERPSPSASTTQRAVKWPQSSMSFVMPGLIRLRSTRPLSRAGLFLPF